MERTRGAPPVEIKVRLLSESSTVTLYVDTARRQLEFVPAGAMRRTFRIAVGKPSTPTPTGRWRITHKRMHPGGVLGSRWMGLNVPTGNYGVHGTNAPGLIGQAVSNGCIRMHNGDVESIYELCPVGTAVFINVGMAPGTGPTLPPGFPGHQGPQVGPAPPSDIGPEPPDQPWNPPQWGSVLRRGDRGSAVRNLQSALAAQGHPPGPIDGIFGPRTEQAVRSFQSRVGIMPTGIACIQTMTQLGLMGGA